MTDLEKLHAEVERVLDEVNMLSAVIRDNLLPRIAEAIAKENGDDADWWKQ